MPEPELVPSEEKAEQAAVNYREGDDVQSCSNCINFISPDACELVMPPIEATDVCDLWEPAGEQGPSAEEFLFGGPVG